jgi:predicted amidohydrolase
LKYSSTVVVGYPEKVDVSFKWPASPEYYNSAIVINDDGETVGGYRKNHLLGTDEAWALEGQDGFFCGEIANTKDVALGISMDITYDLRSGRLNVGTAFYLTEMTGPTGYRHLGCHLSSHSTY